MHHHPGWFTGIPKNEIFWFVNSLAKRIVGEIVADSILAAVPKGMARHCIQVVENGDGGCLSSSVATRGGQTGVATEIPKNGERPK